MQIALKYLHKNVALNTLQLQLLANFRFSNKLDLLVLGLVINW